MNTNLFFPNNSVVSHQIQQVCSSCQVQDDCLAESLLFGIQDGIWAGRDRSVRKSMASQEEVVA